jgi:hypothetical protein
MMKKALAVAPVLLAFGLFGCAQHSAVAPTAARPEGSSSSAPAGDTNTFGDSTDQAAQDAVNAARNKNLGEGSGNSQPSTPDNGSGK